MKQLFEKLKASKLFGISVMYFVAALFAICAIWATIHFYGEKDAKLEKANQTNIELQAMQDSVANATIWVHKRENGGESLYLANENEKTNYLKNSPEYQAKLKESLKLESQSSTIVYKYAVWWVSAINSALAVTLIIFLMLHLNISKQYTALAVKMAPIIYAVNLITLTLILILLP